MMLCFTSLQLVVGGCIVRIVRRLVPCAFDHICSAGKIKCTIVSAESAPGGEWVTLNSAYWWIHWWCHLPHQVATWCLQDVMFSDHTRVYSYCFQRYVISTTWTFTNAKNYHHSRMRVLLRTIKPASSPSVVLLFVLVWSRRMKRYTRSIDDSTVCGVICGGLLVI